MLGRDLCCLLREKNIEYVGTYNTTIIRRQGLLHAYPTLRSVHWGREDRAIDIPTQPHPWESPQTYDLALRI